MMPSIRLLDTLDSGLREFELASAPPYLAVSHAGSDHIFPPKMHERESRPKGYPRMLPHGSSLLG